MADMWAGALIVNNKQTMKTVSYPSNPSENLKLKTKMMDRSCCRRTKVWDEYEDGLLRTDLDALPLNVQAPPWGLLVQVPAIPDVNEQNISSKSYDDTRAALPCRGFQCQDKRIAQFLSRILVGVNLLSLLNTIKIVLYLQNLHIQISTANNMLTGLLNFSRVRERPAVSLETTLPRSGGVHPLETSSETSSVNKY